MKQKTIRSSFSVEGVGLHTGLNISLKASPAPVDYGIRIKRMDVEGFPVLDALAVNVFNTVRGTVIKCGDVQVSTIEHAMAAFYAAGIDNCLFEVNGPEFPILDGSSRFFADEIAKIGVAEQDKDKEFVVIREEIECTSETGSYIRAYPSDKFELEVTIGFDSSVLRNQVAELRDIEKFKDEFSIARTFVFVREIEPLLNMNLIKGGDLKNAIVIYDRLMPQEAVDRLTDKLHQSRIDASKLGYLSGDLYFENEPARHKLLDLIGDLALAGKPVLGRIVAYHPGHKINTDFAKLLREKYITD